MRLDIITLFPRMCEVPLRESILGRAQADGLVELRVVNLRDFSHDRRSSVDDKPYGGGAGMVLLAQPLCEAVESLREPGSRVVFLSPQGRRFNQALAREFARTCAHLILVCGHYEGIDERARQLLFDDEISLGDFVLTNGAIAAVVVADAVIRLLPGVLGSAASAEEESFADRQLLEYPQYTRPAEFRGMRVPDVLMSGDHGRIERWRNEQRILRTAGRRPDLLSGHMETGDE